MRHMKKVYADSAAGSSNKGDQGRSNKHATRKMIAIKRNLTRNLSKRKQKVPKAKIKL